jgi:hypothetical protein
MIRSIFAVSTAAFPCAEFNNHEMPSDEPWLAASWAPVQPIPAWAAELDRGSVRQGLKQLNTSGQENNRHPLVFS